MTAGLINGLSPMQDLTNIVSAPSNTETGTSFSDALKASTDNRNTSADDERPKQVTKEEKTDNKPTEVNEDKKSDNVGKEECEGEKEVKTTKNDDIDKDTEEISEEVIEVINEAATQIIQQIADILEVPVEDVEKALDTIQLETTDLLDTSNIPDIVVELTDAQSAMDIMTDEQLSTDVKEITAKVNEVVEQLSNELEVEPKEIVTVAKDIKVEEKIEYNQNEAEEPVVEKNDIADTTVVNNSSAKNETKSDNEEQHDNTAYTSDFNRSIVDSLKDSIENSQTVQQTGYTTTDTEDIINQVRESIKVNLKADETEMEINLHPASLGNVKVQIAAKDGVITANFTTENETVKAALESQIIELRENMNEQGIKVEAIEVTVASHAFDENLSKEGEQTSTSEEEAKKKKIRSINLNEDAILEDEELDDEIRIARDMMARNGNTVDYLA